MNTKCLLRLHFTEWISHFCQLESCITAGTYTLPTQTFSQHPCSMLHTGAKSQEAKLNAVTVNGYVSIGRVCVCVVCARLSIARYKSAQISVFDASPHHSHSLPLFCDALRSVKMWMDSDAFWRCGVNGEAIYGGGWAHGSYSNAKSYKFIMTMIPFVSSRSICILHRLFRISILFIIFSRYGQQTPSLSNRSRLILYTHKFRMSYYWNAHTSNQLQRVKG